MEWIARALEPLRERLDEEQVDRLVSALALVIGWEAMVVLRDIRGLHSDQKAKTVAWAARALVDAMLTEGDDSASRAAGLVDMTKLERPLAFGQRQARKPSQP